MRHFLRSGLIVLTVWSVTVLGGPAAAVPPLPPELRCLALNIYWEARSGSHQDQQAVAWVTLNRVQSDEFPDAICEVVKQGGEVRRHKCQFSWWCDGKPDEPTNREAWRRAVDVARLVLAEAIPDPTAGAIYFHNDSVRPAWVAKMTETVRIGRHVYYK